MELSIVAEVVEEMIAVVDKDEDGKLSLQEFIRFLYIVENARVNDYASIQFLAADEQYSMELNLE